MLSVTGPHPKYYLTRKACLGILRRSAERGKELPPQLKEALEAQAGVKRIDSKSPLVGACRKKEIGGKGIDKPEIGPLSAAESLSGALLESDTQEERLVGYDPHNGDISGNVSPTLGVNCGMSTGRNGVLKLLAFTQNQRDEVRDLQNVAGALCTSPGTKQQTYVAGVVSKGDGTCFLTEDTHTSLTGGGGQAGQGYPCVLTYDPPELQDSSSVICLNDQGGQFMNISEGVTGTLRSQMAGHPPLVLESSEKSGSSNVSGNIGSVIGELGPLHRIFSSFLGGPHRKVVLHWMNQKLNIQAIIEFANTGRAEGERIIGECSGRLILHIEKLRAGNFKPAKIKVAALRNDLLFARRVNGFIVGKCTHASVYIVFLPETGPPWMDWHKTFQCTFLNDMKFWKDALIAVFGVVDELLNSNEIIPGNNRIVQIFPAMLGAVTHIFSGFVVKVAGSVCLAGQNISTVPLIAEDLENGAGVPDCISSLSLTADLCQSISDLLTGVSKEIKKEDETNDFCLIVIDGQMAGLIVVIAQQYWGQHDAVAKSHLNGGVHDGTLHMGLFLRHGGRKMPKPASSGRSLSYPTMICFWASTFHVVIRRMKKTNTGILSTTN